MLDELLIADGALTDKYKVFVIIQPDFIEDAVLAKIASWVHAGGTLVLFGDKPLKNIAGEPRVTDGNVVRVANVEELAKPLGSLKGCDGKIDGLMTCRRGEQVFIFNGNDQPTAATIDLAGATADIVVQPHTIWSNR